MRYIREALKIFLPKDEGVITNASSVNWTRPFCGATYTAATLSISPVRSANPSIRRMTACT